MQAQRQYVKNFCFYSMTSPDWGKFDLEIPALRVLTAILGGSGSPDPLDLPVQLDPELGEHIGAHRFTKPL
jgi:hypothetical protein